MARKPTETEINPMVVPEIPLEYVEATNAMTVIDAGIADEAEGIYELGRRSGRIELAAFFGQMSELVAIEEYEKIRKSKSWKSLRNPKTGHHVRNIDEYCKDFIGYSERHLRRLSGNKELLGKELYEQAGNAGLRQADYDFIKALPAPKQEIIKEALADDTDKEALQRLIRDLAAADQKEIEALEKRAKSAEENLNAAQRLNADKDKELNAVKTKLFAEQASAAQRTPIDIGEELRNIMQDQAASAEREMRRLRPVMLQLLEHTEAHGISHEEIMLGMICQLERVIWEWKEEFAFNKARPTGDGVGDYFREAGLLTPDDIAADQAAFMAAKSAGRDPRVVDFINGKADQE